MAKALDGTALYTYFRRLGFPRETQELLMHIRSSPPSRTPGARRGNMPVWYPDQINWAAQENALFLEDYYQDLDRLTLEDQTLAILVRLVEEHPGIFLSELQIASGIPADLINIAIARHDLYVDLATCRLSEAWHTPVFRSQRQARASVKPQAKEATVTRSNADETPSSLTPEGQELLDRAREVDR